MAFVVVAQVRVFALVVMLARRGMTICDPAAGRVITRFRLVTIARRGRDVNRFRFGSRRFPVCHIAERR